MKNNELQLYAKTWLSLENITSNERSLSQKNICSVVILFTYNTNTDKSKPYYL